MCCGPCAAGVLKRLDEDYAVTGFFYNPNISPEDEYFRRLVEFEKLCALWHVQHDVGQYEHDRFLEAVRGLEKEPEGGKRCEQCFRLRLEVTARTAHEAGCGVVASTLTIGQNKRAAVINRIGREACAPFGIRFLEQDWKKKDGYKHSVEVSRDLGLYRQDYCGCEFSLK